jgi:hypothetical protein
MLGVRPIEEMVKEDLWKFEVIIQRIMLREREGGGEVVEKN